MDTKKLEKRFETSDKELEDLAQRYESGEWPDGRTVILGRPRISDEDLVSVTLKLPRTQLEAIDGGAKREGKSRSAFMRDLLKLAMTM